jgi:hypothetical protein
MMHAQEDRLFCIILGDMVDKSQTSIDKAAFFSAQVLSHSRSRAITAYYTGATGTGTILKLNR